MTEEQAKSVVWGIVRSAPQDDTPSGQSGRALADYLDECRLKLTASHTAEIADNLLRKARAHLNQSRQIQSQIGDIDTAWQESQRVAGRYRLSERLGAGGYGEVWLAADEQAQPPRMVAIKRIDLDRIPNPQGLPDKCQALVGLPEHPNVVRYLNHGRLLGGYFLVMEYVSGPTLASLLADRQSMPISVVAVARLAGQLAAGVHHCHTRLGAVIGDLKPQNVIVGPGGIPKLIDLDGLKLLGDAGNRPEATGANEGTRHYQAPEQVRRWRLSHRTDVYALGVILYEHLAGTNPLRGLPRRHENDIPSPSDHPDRTRHRPTDPTEARGYDRLSAVCLKCLRSLPSWTRYRTAGNLAAALGNACGQGPIWAWPRLPGVFRPFRWAAYHPRPTYATGIILAVLLVAVVTAGVSSLLPRDSADPEYTAALVTWNSSPVGSDQKSLAELDTADPTASRTSQEVEVIRGNLDRVIVACQDRLKKSSGETSTQALLAHALLKQGALLQVNTGFSLSRHEASEGANPLKLTTEAYELSRRLANEPNPDGNHCTLAAKASLNLAVLTLCRTDASGSVPEAIGYVGESIQLQARAPASSLSEELLREARLRYYELVLGQLLLKNGSGAEAIQAFEATEQALANSPRGDHTLILSMLEMTRIFLGESSKGEEDSHAEKWFVQSFVARTDTISIRDRALRGDIRQTDLDVTRLSKAVLADTLWPEYRTSVSPFGSDLPSSIRVRYFQGLNASHDTPINRWHLALSITADSMVRKGATVPTLEVLNAAQQQLQVAYRGLPPNVDHAQDFAVFIQFLHDQKNGLRGNPIPGHIPTESFDSLRTAITTLENFRKQPEFSDRHRRTLASLKFALGSLHSAQAGDNDADQLVKAITVFANAADLDSQLGPNFDTAYLKVERALRLLARKESRSAQNDRVAHALRIASTLRGLARTSGGGFYDCACAFATVSTTQPDDSVRQELLDSAIECLRHARRKGVPTEELRNKPLTVYAAEDADLAPLRSSPAFQTWLKGEE